MASTWFDKVIPNNLSWGLIDRHRARYFLLISILLFVYGAVSLLLWLFVGGEVSVYTVSFWVFVAVVGLIPIIMLYADKSLKHIAIALFLGQFLIVNSLIQVSGNLSSPMMPNLFYLPLIALLPGDVKLAIVSSISCVLAILAHFIFGNMGLQVFFYSLLSHEYWFQWNLIACVAISGVLALAYEKTVQDMSFLLTREIKMSERELLKDDLTGLANKTMLEHYTEALIFQSERLSQRFSMVYINIKDFSNINKEYGHHSGDQALQLLAKRLLGIVRKTDMVARLKGDRFVIVLANIKEAENTVHIIEKLTRLLNEALMINKHELSLVYEIGFVNFSEDGASLEELLEKLSGTMPAEPYLSEVTYVGA